MNTEMMEMTIAHLKRAAWSAIATIGIGITATAQESVLYIYPDQSTEPRGATTLCPLPDGGFYLARLVYDFSTVPPGRFVVERMGADAEVDEVRGYHNGSIYSLAMQHSSATTDEGLVSIGRIIDPVSLKDSICVLRLAATGEVLWSKSVGFAGTTHYAAGILPLADGGSLAYGTYRDTTTNKRPVFLVKFSAAGEVVWSTSITSTVQFEHFTIGGVVEEMNGDLWLAGEGRSTSTWLLRADADGMVQQRYALDLPGIYDGLWGDVRGLFKRSDGDLDLFYSEFPFDTEYDITVVRISTGGEVLQTRSSSFSDNSFGLIPLVRQLPNGDYLFSGDKGGYAAHVGMIDQQGAVQWAQRFQYQNFRCEFRNVMPTSDGSVRVHGNGFLSESGSVLQWLVRTSQWDPNCYATALDPTSITGTGSTFDFELIQGPGPEVANTTAYMIETDAPREMDCGNVGVREEATQPAYIFPNPTNGAFTIATGAPSAAYVRVIAMTGQVVVERSVNSGMAVQQEAGLECGLYSVAWFTKDGSPLGHALLTVAP